MHKGTAFGTDSKTTIMKFASTVLFLNDHPVGYKVIERGCRYLFLPTRRNRLLFEAPAISAIKQDQHWIVEGTEDISLIQQVKEECNIKFPDGVSKELNAAP